MRVRFEDVPFWFHDLVSCLHNCLGSVLLHAGHDPITTMGAGWSFFHRDVDVTTEEFYFPSPNGDLGRDLFPFHDIEAVWRHPSFEQEGWAGIRGALLDGRLAITAEDNFFMPMRPAYGDVHAAHLMVVTGFDDELDEVYLLESTPPQYDGPMVLADFHRARWSDNEARAGTRDFFFAGSGVAGRWIDVRIDADPVPPTRDWVAHVLEENLSGLHAEQPEGAVSGLPGVRSWLGDVTGGADPTEAVRRMGELYIAGWAHQAAAALHADFLVSVGATLAEHRLVEAGRAVDAVANAWTPVRILGAHGSTQGLAVAAELQARCHELVGAYESAALHLERTLTGLGDFE